MTKPKSDLSLIINTRWASELLIQTLNSYEKYSEPQQYVTWHW